VICSCRYSASIGQLDSANHFVVDGRQLPSLALSLNAPPPLLNASEEPPWKAPAALLWKEPPLAELLRLLW
jgi:hypothetical protein